MLWVYAEEIVKLALDYSKKGVMLVAISSNSVKTHPQDGPELMAEDARNFGEFTFGKRCSMTTLAFQAQYNYSFREIGWINLLITFYLSPQTCLNLIWLAWTPLTRDLCLWALASYTIMCPVKSKKFVGDAFINSEFFSQFWQVSHIFWRDCLLNSQHGCDWHWSTQGLTQIAY